jgi:membrane-bound ClpP family serine protease
MLIAGIVFIIIIGLLLLFVEFFVVPGISIAGIGAVILIFSGIILAFVKLGSQEGIIALLASLFLAILMLYYALKPKTWNRISLKEDIDSKASDTSLFDKIKPGDKGIALSRLAPMGEIEINGINIEAVSSEGFVDEGSQVEVISNNKFKILIKPL